MNSERRFFSGDTLAQALNQAAQQFQMEPTEIRYTLIEKRHGFLRTRRKVMIEVNGADPAGRSAEAQIEGETAPPEPAPTVQTADPETADSESAAEAEPEPEPEPGAHEGSMLLNDVEEGGRKSSHVELSEAPLSAATRFPTAEGEEAEAARKALEKILGVSSIDVQSKILQGEEQLEIELWGADQDILLRDRGRLLLAIQHLLPRVIRGLIGRSVVCRVDSDSFHEIREERLRDMAQRAADEVRQGGRPKRLEPMSPDERRIVHLTLADYPGIETESQGSGLFKRVTVRQVEDGRSRGVGSYNR